MTSSLCFIVNPQSQGGKTGKIWEKRYGSIKNRLEGYDLQYTVADGIGKGVEATLDAANSGFHTVISVGGEGTANEVLNGLMQINHNKRPKMGFIRSGTVNDYLKAITWPHDLDAQIEVIKKQEYITTPVVKVTGETSKYGLNVADIGVGAKIAYMASVERRLTWIRSALRYQLLSLRAVMGWKNIEATIDIDGTKLSGQLSLLTAGFSPFSGAYHLHPHAEIYGNKMAYTIAMNFSKLDMIKKMGMLQKGNHHNDMDDIYMSHANKISITTDTPTLFEVDGEPFSEPSRSIIIEAHPNAIDIIKA